MKPLRSQATFCLIGFVLIASLSVGALKSKPAPEFPEDGAPLDVSDWSFCKPVEVVRSGAQQLELDLDVLSHARRDFGDLRLLRYGKQVPYILERTSINREVAPEVTVTNDSKNVHISRWVIKLPRAHIPITRLMCESSTGMFQRDVSLYQENSGEHGEKYRQRVAQEMWMQTPTHMGKKFTVEINFTPRGDTLYLETDNGDNPPIELEKFRLFYPITRLLFKAKADDVLLLYYGEPEAAAPRYDLSLVANELLAADKATASLGVETVLKETRTPTGTSGKGGAVFWGILGLVVVALLVVIARMLPKSDAQPPK